MKLLSLYASLKKKSIELLSNGNVEEYMKALMQLAHLEKEMVKLSMLN